MKAVTVANTPMIQLDLNMKVLKDHLDLISGALNQHSELLNNLQVDVQQKVTQKIIVDILGFLGESTKFSNPQIASVINNDLAHQKKLEATGNEFDNKRNKLANQLLSFGYAITQNHTQISQIQKQVKEISEQIGLKCDRDYVKKRFKKIKQRTKNNLEEQRLGLVEIINSGDKKVSQTVLEWEDKLLNMEKKTLWKINEQEEQIKRRVVFFFLIFIYYFDNFRLLVIMYLMIIIFYNFIRSQKISSAIL